MSALLKQFLAIALLKSRPQDLPAQPVVLWIAVGMAMLLGTVGLLSRFSLGAAFLNSALAIIVSAIFLFGFLGLRGRRERFKQSFTALCGSSAVVSLVALPIMPALAEQAGPGRLIILIVLALDVWTLAIAANIFKHTFEVGFATGISMAVMLMILTLVVLHSLQPPAPAQESLQGLSSQVPAAALLASNDAIVASGRG